MSQFYDPFEEYTHYAETTYSNEVFIQFQQEEIYKRNNPEKLPELKPLATGMGARGVVRKRESNDDASDSPMNMTKKRQN